MMSVSALLLIVKTNAGSQCLFSYPASPQRKAAPNTSNYASNTTSIGLTRASSKDNTPKGRSNNRRGSLSTHSGHTQQDKQPNQKLPQAATHRSILDDGILGFEVEFLSSVLSPKASLCDAKLEITIDNVTFVAQSSTLTSRPPLPASNETTPQVLSTADINAQSDEMPSPSDDDSSMPDIRLTMFTLVFAMEATDTSSFRGDVEAACSVISQLATALQEEQLKNGYVRNQMEIILSIRDACAQEDVAQLLEKSSLARALADVYTSYTSAPASDAPPQGLRPYHALLLLHDPEEILNTPPPPPRASAAVLQTLYPPELTTLIPLVTPTRSFAELSAASEYTLDTLYALAAHLVFWRKARIIDAVTLKNIYVLESRACMDAGLFRECKTRFPQLDVVQFLGELSFPRPLAQVIPVKEQQSMYLEAVMYLLRRGVLKQLHLYLNLLPMSPDMGRADYARLIARQLRPSFVPMFEQLVQYMDGKHHLEEIVYLENLARRDIKKLLAAAPEVVTVLH
ncbi:hypothetical protein SeMB42_g03997 [Synchytrium endobioticum]|uniref:Nitrogen permease regulator 3 n=1 Tax=Synchytrium endobioticum TaxID=286115 RepID=A0A507D1V8_9FUNG|nr:hypothetical protein SeMB42_g03997 [Synchytrium endobioticum]TPX50070.1 hypothetical protein SeLEV6574_g01113 [Synchytrium endobioticum]